MKGMAQELGVNKKSVRKAVKLPGAHSLARTKRFLLSCSPGPWSYPGWPEPKRSWACWRKTHPLCCSPILVFHHLPSMMCGLVSSECKKINPIFLDSGLRLDPELYIEQVLVPHMLPLILKNNPYHEEYIFMQGGAPCNTSKKTQKWLKEQINFWSKEVWPPRSHDLNSVDFPLWAKA